MKNWSLRVQILVLVLALVAVSLAVIGGTAYQKIQEHLYEGLESKAVSLATVMAENVGPGIEFQDTTYINETVASMFKDIDVRGITIFALDSTVVYSTLLDSNLAYLSEMCNYIEDVVVEHKGDYCIIESSVKVRGREVACLWLAMSKRDIQAEIRDSLVVIVLVAALVFVLAVLIGSVVTARMVKPIKVFEQAASRVGFGDMLSPVDLAELHKDFKPLGAVFNEMQEALKGAFSELARSRDSLEVQVADRTRELSDELAERKRTEQALRFTQFAVDHGADPAFWMGKDGRFIYVNDAACSVLGYSRDELLKMRVFDVDMVLTEDLWEPHWNDLRRQGSFAMESSHRAKSGKIIPVEVTVNYMEYEGQEYNCAFARDISERKKTEERRQELQEQLERAQRMESIGLLAGGVAHDLNNMLGPVVGYAELMLLGLKDDDKMRKRVERIAKSASDAADVIQDLLALARRGRYEMTPTSLNEVVAQYLDSPSYLHLTKQRPDVAIQINLDDKIGNLIGSEPHLSKVVMNLIVNAFDAMSEGGELAVSTELKYLEQLEEGLVTITPGRYLILRVRDTGGGIAAEDIDHIFEPYYSKKKMGKSGTGLGLSVVYGIVKDHKGYYDIKSELGEGTEFVLYFPATNEKRHADRLSEDLMVGSETVLVVDDSSEQREIAKELLESLGHTVDTVENGHLSLEYLERRRVDLVVLDMIMEVSFDGLDTYREIIKKWPNQNVIIVTGYSSTERVEEMQRLGAGAYVRKPFTRESLSRAIRDVFDKTEVPVSTK